MYAVYYQPDTLQIEATYTARMVESEVVKDGRVIRIDTTYLSPTDSKVWEVRGYKLAFLPDTGSGFPSRDMRLLAVNEGFATGIATNPHPLPLEQSPSRMRVVELRERLRAYTIDFGELLELLRLERGM